ncbi:MAG: hypothetical protein ACW981_21090 [Candidatus Hodarchaeales archaeon]|jgi:hypothetical protein
MLNQIFVVDDVIGFALLIGLSLMLVVLTKVPLFKGFICYCLVIAPFLYKAGYIDLWVIVALIVLMIYVITISIASKRRGI